MKPRSWKPAGMEGLFWMKGLPAASLGSCLWTSALWRSRPRCVRKVTQQMSHLREEDTGRKEAATCPFAVLCFPLLHFKGAKQKGRDIKKPATSR